MSHVALRCAAAILGLLSLTAGVVGQPLPEHALFQLKGHSHEVYCVAWSPQGKYLASSGRDGTLRLWDLTTGKEYDRLGPFSSGITAVKFSPVDGRLVALAGLDGAVRLLDWDTGRELWKAQYGDVLCSLSFAPDGKTIASGGFGGTMVVWDAATGRRLLTMKCHDQVTSSLAFSPGGHMIASGSGNQNAVLWDIAGERLCTLRGSDRVTGVAFSPDGKTLAVVGPSDKGIRLWETASGRERRKIPHDGDPLTVAFSPDGRTLATVAYEDCTVYLWDANTGAALGRFSGHDRPIRALAFSPEGDRLATGSYDTTAIVWDVKTITKRRSFASRISTDHLDAIWADLAGADAELAYRNIWSLAADPATTLPWLREKLQKIPPRPSLDKLIADLDADEFEVREDASRALERLRAAARPELRQALRQRELSPEARRRIRDVLERELIAIAPGSDDALRCHRVVEILERIGGDDARKLLEKMTAKEFGADVVEEANASLERLKRASNRP
jgi:WD40 repeat protein